jgi:hypothetical protein
VANAVRRNRLLPWYIGIAIVVPAVIYVGYLLYTSGCAVPVPTALMVLVAIPLVYLVLMYLTFTSQE